MSANIVTTLPLGPLDPERTELLLRVVEGLEPSTLQWLSGFAAGVAHERAAGRAGVSLPVGPVVAPAVRAEPTARLTIVLRFADGQQQAHRRASRPRRRSRGSRRARLCRRQLPGEGPGEGTHAGAGRQHAGRRRSAGRRAWPDRIPAVAPRAETRAAVVLGARARRFELPEILRDRQAGGRAAPRARRPATPRPRRLRRRLRHPRPRWLERGRTGARDTLGGSTQSATVTRLRTAPVGPPFSREQPFAAEVITNQSLTGAGATSKSVTSRSASPTPASRMRRATRSVCGTRIRRIVSGSAAGAAPRRRAGRRTPGTAKPLREWLTTGRELTRLTRPFLTQQAERSKDARLADMLLPGHEIDPLAEPDGVGQLMFHSYSPIVEQVCFVNNPVGAYLAGCMMPPFHPSSRIAGYCYQPTRA